MVEEEGAGMERERGTLRRTLPRRPDVIFGIANVFAASVAVYCCRLQVHSLEGWPALVVAAALSSLSVIVGIVYVDSAIHSLFLGLAVSNGVEER